MKKYKSLVIILGVVVFFILLASLGRFTNQPKMIFFYGDTCPHCHDVSAYIDANGIKDKLEFRELETYRNRNNAQLLTAKAKLCKLDTSQGVPVPFFYDGENCHIGSDVIIEFFEERTAAPVEVEGTETEAAPITE